MEILKGLIFVCFKAKLPIEPIKYPEERRIFYVALTRTRNRVFILLNNNIENQSEFISELKELSGDKIRYLD